MKKIMLAAGFAALAAVVVAKDYSADVSTPEKKTEVANKFWFNKDGDNIALWPAGKIPLRIHDDKTALKDDELKESNVVLTKVNDPFFRFYPAAGEGVKPCVVICPGGGYFQIGMNKEGTEIADWLNSIGFSAVVLAYRCSGQDQRDGALCDAQRMIRVLRRDAKKYRIDPAKIGIIGFSAGANLVIRTSTNWKKAKYEKVDDADDFSCRPDYQLAVYPWDVCKRLKVSGGSGCPYDWSDEYNQEEYPVDKETPPAFITQTLDDFCRPQTALAYDMALTRAGVSSTLKIYQKGGHGYGLRQLGNPCDAWSFEAASWLTRIVLPK